MSSFNYLEWESSSSAAVDNFFSMITLKLLIHCITYNNSGLIFYFLSDFIILKSFSLTLKALNSDFRFSLVSI